MSAENDQNHEPHGVAENGRPSNPSDYGSHAYDGIVENDNPLPGWWQWILYGTIVFAVLYYFDFQVLHVHKTPAEKYEVAAAAEQKAQAEKALATGAITDEALVALSKDPGAIGQGKDTFTSTCAACHKADGSGNIGPNLTDAFWLHGNKPTEIYKTVHDGWPAKGMPNWGPTLGDQKVASVTAYVLTIKNTNVPGGKAPQGDKAE